MKCKVKKVDFLRELKLMVKVAPSKPVQPVLSGILIQAKDTALVMTATDLNVGLIGACPAEVGEPGSIILPVNQLFHLVKAQSGDVIDLSSDKKSGVTFRCGKFKSSFKTFDVEDFPTIPDVEGDTVLLGRDSLKQMFPKVTYVVSGSNANPILGFILVELAPQSVQFVAASGPCLSIVKTEREGDEAVDLSLIHI